MYVFEPATLDFPAVGVGRISEIGELRIPVLRRIFSPRQLPIAAICAAQRQPGAGWPHTVAFDSPPASTADHRVDVTRFRAGQNSMLAERAPYEG
jgi:hypothetical protein